MLLKTMFLFGSSLAVLLCLVEKVFFAEGQTDLSDWDAFKKQYNKRYANAAEEQLRRLIYLSNKKVIDQYNALHDQGVLSYNLKMNEFGDLLLDEFVSAVNGYYGSGGGDGGEDGDSRSTDREPASHFVSPANVVLPQSVDWRTRGAVTPVKDQGQCGCCWAFSAIGSLEGQHWRKTGDLVSLSEQQLMDCSSDYGNSGCDGGVMVDAFRYIKDIGGVVQEDEYPYEEEEGDCRYDADLSVANITGYVRIPTGDETKLQAAVATVGPVSIAFDASHKAFQFYNDGIYYEPECSSSLLDHGVLVVGYGSEGGVDYWIVKNSWGTNWGEQGYFRVRRNLNNHCGVATDASYPLV